MKKKIYVSFVVVFCFVIALFIFVTLDIFSKQKFDRALRITPKAIQRDVVDRLKTLNIPFQIDDNGFIRYPSAHEKIINEVTKEVKNTYYLGLPNVSFSDNQSKKYFLTLLQEAKIPYQIKKLDAEGNDYIVWEQEYNDKVQELIMKVNEKIGITERPLRLTLADREEKEILMELMREENIPFRLVKDSARGGEAIEFDWKYDSRIGELIEKAYAVRRKKVQQEKR